MVKISIHVDDKVWIAFKNYVLAKYGKLHGVLGREVSKALEEYLTHSHEEHTRKFEQQIFKLNRKQHSLLLYILDFCEICNSDIENFIKFKMGFIDRRTIKKYVQFLLENKFITPKKALHGKNVIYTVNKDRILSILKEFLDNDQLNTVKPQIETVGVRY